MKNIIENIKKIILVAALALPALDHVVPIFPKTKNPGDALIRSSQISHEDEEQKKYNERREAEEKQIMVEAYRAYDREQKYRESLGY